MLRVPDDVRNGFIGPRMVRLLLGESLVEQSRDFPGTVQNTDNLHSFVSSEENDVFAMRQTQQAAQKVISSATHSVEARQLTAFLHNLINEVVCRPFVIGGDVIPNLIQITDRLQGNQRALIHLFGYVPTA